MQTTKIHFNDINVKPIKIISNTKIDFIKKVQLAIEKKLNKVKEGDNITIIFGAKLMVSKTIQN